MFGYLLLLISFFFGLFDVFNNKFVFKEFNLPIFNVPYLKENIKYNKEQNYVQ